MHPLCEFGDDLVCKHCGFRAKFPRVKRHCTTPRPLAARLSSYAAALARWIRAGRPIRDEDEIHRILAEHCTPCDRFRDGVCDACGCRVNASPRGWTNKIAMATESCPLPVPRWAASLGEGTGPLRVALVTPVMLAGGVESWHIAMARELAKPPDVRVACVGYLGAGGTWHEDVARELAEHAPIVGVVDSEHARPLASSWEVLQVAAASADVLIVWSIAAAELQFVRQNFPGKVVVGVSHGEADWWMAAAAPYVDRWVAVSARARPPIPSLEVAIIDNGVDVDRCVATLSREAVRDTAGIPRDARLIVSIGRLSPEKRTHLLAGALDRLPSDCWLWLVGDGREADRCREAAGRAIDRLVISPARRDVGNVLGAADCFAFASQGEGYGLAPVEALAAGVPLAATPVGVLPSLGDCAEWIPRDPTLGEVADAILAAFARDRAKIEASRALVTAEHSAAAMARRWAAYLTEVSHAPPAARPVAR